MHRALMVALLMTALALAGCADGPNETEAPPPGVTVTEADDAVVVAVLDFGFNPYHWDFAAEHMPQHLDDDPTNDLPLESPPHTWLPGFPTDPDAAFVSYTGMNLSLAPDDPDADPHCTPGAGGIILGLPPSEPAPCPEDNPGLYNLDEDAWNAVQASAPNNIHFNYIPGTKVVGYVNFDDSYDGFAAASHGGGSSSVSTGNLFGTCPECLFVFVNFGEGALDWINEQEWIDAVTNSYGAGSFQALGLVRDNIYAACNIELERQAVERGQSIVWSAGNGLANAFMVPPLTLASCEKGLDWIITIGAIDPDTDASFLGHGKPVNLANIGRSYPRAGGATVTDEGTFGGTSNAAPTTTGLYAGALYDLRKALPGASRVQADGAIAVGEMACGDANADCPLVDGEVTVHEFRDALYRAAQRTGPYFVDGQLGLEIPVGSDETEHWTEGYGSFHGRLGDFRAERQAIFDEATGATYDAHSPETVDWMTAYSYCSQQVWGTWEFGVWSEGEAPPSDDPQWPYRAWLTNACPETVSALVTVGSTVGPTHP